MDIFGINCNSTIKELKKKYYELALLCHPDQGGNKEDMQVIFTSYLHAKEQLEHKDESEKKMNTLLENLEKGILHTEIPSIRDIFDDVYSDFHKPFEKHNKDISSESTNYCNDNENPYSKQGYGDYMLSNYSSTLSDKDIVYNPNIEQDIPLIALPDLQNQNKQNKVETTQTLSNITPESSTSIGYPIHVNTLQHINDFSVINESNKPTLSLYDYRLAYGEIPNEVE